MAFFLLANHQAISGESTSAYMVTASLPAIKRFDRGELQGGRKTIRAISTPFSSNDKKVEIQFYRRVIKFFCGFVLQFISAIFLKNDSSNLAVKEWSVV